LAYRTPLLDIEIFASIFEQPSSCAARAWFFDVDASESAGYGIGERFDLRQKDGRQPKTIRRAML